MIVYLYAVVEDLGEVAGIAGASGEPLTLETREGLSVVMSRLPETPAVSPDRLRDQDHVVRALHERAAALLPMRFGASFPTTEAAWSALAVHDVGLRDRLTHVRGREQMTVRVTRRSGDSQPPERRDVRQAATAGAAYLRERARPAELEYLLAAVGTRVRATRIEPGRSPGMVATVYHLIDRGTSEAYRAALESVAARQTHHQVRISGPAPCYAFT